MTVQLVTMSRAEAEAYQPEPGDACISIMTPQHSAAVLKAGWAAVLQLWFYDLPENQEHVLERREMSSTQAEQLIAFVRRWTGSLLPVKRFVIHCDAGKSRSVSVREALEYVVNHTIPMLVPAPNMQVYTAVLEAAKLPQHS